jgi:hypothetical protein
LPRFVLLLYGGSSAPNPGAVREYSLWAKDLRAHGHAISGGKLKDSGTTLSPGRDSDEASALGGYFIVSAHDLGEALSLARTCPHLKHGGRIEVRPIDPT